MVAVYLHIADLYSQLSFTKKTHPGQWSGRDVCYYSNALQYFRKERGDRLLCKRSK